MAQTRPKLMTLEEAISQLTKFATYHVTKSPAEKLILELEHINNLFAVAREASAEEVEEINIGIGEIINQMASTVNQWLDDKTFVATVNQESFHDLLFKIMQALSAIKPGNETDPNSLERTFKISPDDTVRTSHLKLYDINWLAGWIKSSRTYKDPLTNEPFKERDIAEIKRVAERQGVDLTIQEEKREVQEPTEFDLVAIHAVQQRPESPVIQRPMLSQLSSRPTPQLLSQRTSQSSNGSSFFSRMENSRRVENFAIQSPENASLVFQNREALAVLFDGAGTSDFNVFKLINIAESHPRSAVLILRTDELREKMLGTRLKDGILLRLKLLHRNDHELQMLCARLSSERVTPLQPWIPAGAPSRGMNR